MGITTLTGTYSGRGDDTIVTLKPVEDRLVRGVPYGGIGPPQKNLPGGVRRLTVE